MRVLTITALALFLVVAQAFAAVDSAPPAPMPPVAKADTRTITLYVGCESGKCTPVKCPVGSLVTVRGTILVPAYVDANGVQVYKDHPEYGGSCQGGSCSGAASCNAGGVCSSCTTCTAVQAGGCSSGNCSPPSAAYRLMPVGRAYSAGSCPNCR